MTKMPAKKKIGRPATGRDPTLTIRVPQEMLDTVHRAVEYMQREDDGVTASDIWREAMYLGLQQISGNPAARGMYLPRYLRPEHHAEVHEAGHAVAEFLCAEDAGRNPDECVSHVVLKPRGGGYMKPATSTPPIQDLRVIVAGAVAESLQQGLTFQDIWAGHGCSGDRRLAAKLIKKHGLHVDDAVDYIAGKFFRFEVWAGLVAVARGLVIGKSTGFLCWHDYQQARDEALKRKPKTRGVKKMKWAVKEE